mgnify:CR=1 FL=1
MTNLSAHFADQRQHMVDLLTEMVKVESPSSDKAAVDRMGAFIKHQFETAGATVDVQMANVFVNRLQETNDLNSACQAVQAIIDERDEALGFINRYGVRSPTYTALDLCPY